MRKSLFIGLFLFSLSSLSYANFEFQQDNLGFECHFLDHVTIRNSPWNTSSGLRSTKILQYNKEDPKKSTHLYAFASSSFRHDYAFFLSANLDIQKKQDGIYTIHFNAKNLYTGESHSKSFIFHDRKTTESDFNLIFENAFQSKQIESSKFELKCKKLNGTPNKKEPEENFHELHNDDSNIFYEED